MSNERCPRDGGVLRERDGDGVRTGECIGCGGHWIGGDVLRQALSSRGVDVVRGAHGLRVGVGCPVCAVPMAEAEIEGCTVDVCRRCGGLWLDAGEGVKLRRLFPASSGVLAADSARMEEASRSKGPAGRFLKALSEILGASLHRD